MSFTHRPAVDPNCPEILKNTALLQSDFSSATHVLQKHDQTCSYSETHNCNALQATFDPRSVDVVDLYKDNPRTTKKSLKDNATQKTIATNVVFLGHSKKSGSAEHDHAMLEDVMSMLKEGCLSNNSKAKGKFPHVCLCFFLLL